MKKISLSIFGFFSAIAISMAVLCCIGVFPSQKNAPHVNAETVIRESIFKQPGLATLTQEGKIFDSYNSFYQNLSFADGKSYPAIYTNKNLTLSITHTFKGLDSYSLWLYTEDNLIGTRIGSNSQGVDTNYYKTYLKDGISIPCYVFNNLNTPTNTPVLLKLSFIVSSSVYYLDFILVQTDNNFNIDDNLSWEYNFNNQTEWIKAPSNDKTYTPLTLHVPNGTQLNPTYVKFTFLGEIFTIYNIDGEFYNNYNGTKLNIQEVLFDLSGTYNVEIYDRTKFCYSDSNYNSYNFFIKNKNDPFYIYGHNKNGNVVANNQVTNSDVVVDFVNLNDIYKNVDQIIVTKSYRPSGGENISEETKYPSSSNIPSSLTFSADGTYNIRVVGKTAGQIIKEYDFILINTIRSHFEKDNKTYEIGPNDPDNTYKTFNISSSFPSTYKNITSKTDYNFNVTIAKSEPSISGINNNGRKQGGVSLTVYGVGKIQVNITQDGKALSPIEATNGQKLEKLDTPGKYYVKITDEMGTTVTKSFTITVKMNAAAKAIIIVGAILVVALVAIIIISRARVRVR